jgi:hypothetical protein
MNNIKNSRVFVATYLGGTFSPVSKTLYFSVQGGLVVSVQGLKPFNLIAALSVLRKN